MKGLLLALALVLVLPAPLLLAQRTGEVVSLPLRGPTPIDKEGTPPLLRPQANTLRQTRNYPEQPPVIPHSIEAYQIDLNGNKCLSCHARARTSETQAPPISISHYMDRDGQFLATMSPRRYVCTQCHVAQDDVNVPIVNTFIDIDTLLSRDATDGRK